MSQFIPFEFVNWAMRLLLAQGVIVLFLLLNVVSFSMPHAGDFKPFFLLMAVYYWAIYRPTVMPVAYTFVLGLILDFLTNLPPGLSALVLLVLQTVVRRSRLFMMGQPFMMVWLGFGILAMVYTLSFWFMMSLANFQFVPYASLVQMLMAAILSFLFYPLASLILLGVHKTLPMETTHLRSVG